MPKPSASKVVWLCCSCVRARATQHVKFTDKELEGCETAACKECTTKLYNSGWAVRVKKLNHATFGGCSDIDFSEEEI